MSDLDEMMAEFTPEEQREIHELADTWMAVADLVRLREERAISQQRMAEMLGVSQSRVSRLERAEDLQLSTLRRYIETLGGTLHVEATFPEEKTVRLNVPALGTKTA